MTIATRFEGLPLLTRLENQMDSLQGAARKILVSPDVQAGLTAEYNRGNGWFYASGPARIYDKVPIVEDAGLPAGTMKVVR